MAKALATAERALADCKRRTPAHRPRRIGGAHSGKDQRRQRQGTFSHVSALPGAARAMPISGRASLDHRRGRPASWWASLSYFAFRDRISGAIPAQSGSGPARAEIIDHAAASMAWAGQMQADARNGSWPGSGATWTDGRPNAPAQHSFGALRAEGTKERCTLPPPVQQASHPALVVRRSCGDFPHGWPVERMEIISAYLRQAVFRRVLGPRSASKNEPYLESRIDRNLSMEYGLHWGSYSKPIAYRNRSKNPPKFNVVSLKGVTGAKPRAARLRRAGLCSG